jgi:hypothetical protein
MKNGAWRGFSRAAGLVFGKTLGNGVEYTALFDAVNRQVTCTWEVGNQTLAGYNYAYDDASNRKYEEKIHDPGNSQLYQYDTLYQVNKFEAGQLDGTKTSILAPDRTQGWNYDPMGNWRRFIDSEDGRQQRRHNEVNEITQITEVGPRRRSAVSPSSRSALRQPAKTALSYDPNGNLLDDGEYLYAWDAFNRLVEVRLKRNSRTVGQYFYDAMHRRTKRLANLDGNASLETNVTYVYDGFNCISEISNLQSGITTKSYVWGNDINGGLQAAGGVGGLIAVLSSGPHPSSLSLLPPLRRPWQHHRLHQFIGLDCRHLRLSSLRRNCEFRRKRGRILLPLLHQAIRSGNRAGVLQLPVLQPGTGEMVGKGSD